MRKIVLNIVGIAQKHGRNGDWRKSNIIEQIVNPLKEDNDVSIYLTTYPKTENETIDFRTRLKVEESDNVDINSLKELYTPKNVNLLPYEGSDQRLTYISSLKTLKDVDCDVIISTRFDMFFHKNIVEFENINYDKFNFLCIEKSWWKNFEFTNDNFYIFNKKYLDAFIDSIDEHYKTPPRSNCADMHGIYKFIVPKIGIDNINFISENHMMSTRNDYYTLNRYI